MTRVTPARVGLLAVLVVLAVLAQTTLVARLPLPGAPPDLVLVLAIAVGLTAGRSAGTVVGFGAGLLADSQTDHQLGRLALAYLVAGHLAGRLGERSTGGRARTLAVALLGSATALAVYLAEGLALTDPRTAGPALGLGLLVAVAYDVLLAPVVLPAVSAIVRGSGSTR